MRAKQINENIGDLLQPKKLDGYAKLVFDASKDLNSIGMKTSEIDSYSLNLGFLSFDILNTRRNFQKRVLMRYYDKELWNKYTKSAKDGAEIDANRWEVINYNAPQEQAHIKFGTWEEAKLHLLQLLHPDINGDIHITSKEKENAEIILKEKTDRLIMLENIKDILY